MMVPPQVTLIPNYLVLKHVPFFGGNDWAGSGGHGWLDSFHSFSFADYYDAHELELIVTTWDGDGA